MENYGRSGFILFFLGIFLLLGLSKAENKTEPRRNVNLGPIQGWRSAYYCMIYNISPSCTLRRAVTVRLDQIDEYCDKGCYAHTMAVLKCMNDVKRDFWFAMYSTSVTPFRMDAVLGKLLLRLVEQWNQGVPKAYVSVISSLVLVAIFNL